jgi:hypothetical protein
MCYFSSVFKCFPFLCILMMSFISVIVTYLCPLLSVCCIVCLWVLFHQILYFVPRLKAIFICMSLNIIFTSHISFPLYVKVVHFSFLCCGPMSVFCLCLAVCYLILFSSYLCFYSVLFVIFNSFSFASFENLPWKKSTQLLKFSRPLNATQGKRIRIYNTQETHPKRYHNTHQPLSKQAPQHIPVHFRRRGVSSRNDELHGAETFLTSW